MRFVYHMLKCLVVCSVTIAVAVSQRPDSHQPSTFADLPNSGKSRFSDDSSAWEKDMEWRGANKEKITWVAVAVDKSVQQHFGREDSDVLDFSKCISLIRDDLRELTAKFKQAAGNPNLQLAIATEAASMQEDAVAAHLSQREIQQVTKFYNSLHLRLSGVEGVFRLRNVELGLSNAQKATLRRQAANQQNSFYGTADKVFAEETVSSLRNALDDKSWGLLQKKVGVLAANNVFPEMAAQKPARRRGDRK